MAHAALGCGDGAQEGGVVVLVDQQAQPGAQILDLGAVEVALPARHLVGHLRGAQLLLEHACLVVGAVEDGEVAELHGAAARAQRRDARHGALGLVLLAVALHHLHRVAFAELTPQLLLEDLGVLGDHLVGCAQDGASGAVVLLQRDDLQPRIVLRQALEVVDGGAAPAVDALVVVAHGGEGRVLAHQGLEQFVLHGVGVLVLVHQQVAESVLPLAPGLGIGAQQLQWQADQVIEVHRLVSVQALLVALHHLGRRELQIVFGHGSGLGGVQPLVLPQADGPLPAPRGLGIGGATGIAQHAQHVVAVEDGEVFLQTESRAVGTQHAHAQRMESADHQVPRRTRTHQGLGALAHLGGGLVRKGDGRNLPGLQPRLQQLGNLVHDDARLARASAGQHEARPVQVVHGLGLGGVERGRGFGHGGADHSHPDLRGSPAADAP